MLSQIIKDGIVFGIINIGYFTYLEMNPRTNGIVLRPNAENKKILSIGSIKNFIAFPFTPTGLPIMWKPENWDINYTVVMTMSFGIYKFNEFLFRQIY
jgi:hypothetical protein